MANIDIALCDYTLLWDTFKDISNAKRKMSALAQRMTKCFNHATEPMLLSFHLHYYIDRYTFFFSFTSSCAQWLLVFVSSVSRFTSMLPLESKWNRLCAAMHVSYSCLHGPIKVVIAVNFKSKNINKCHPSLHIVSSFSMFIRIVFRNVCKAFYKMQLHRGCPPD